MKTFQKGVFVEGAQRATLTEQGVNIDEGLNTALSKSAVYETDHEINELTNDEINEIIAGKYICVLCGPLEKHVHYITYNSEGYIDFTSIDVESDSFYTYEYTLNEDTWEYSLSITQEFAEKSELPVGFDGEVAVKQVAYYKGIDVTENLAGKLMKFTGSPGFISFCNLEIDRMYAIWVLSGSIYAGYLSIGNDVRIDNVSQSYLSQIDTGVKLYKHVLNYHGTTFVVISNTNTTYSYLPWFNDSVIHFVVKVSNQGAAKAFNCIDYETVGNTTKVYYLDKTGVTYLSIDTSSGSVSDTVTSL